MEVKEPRERIKLLVEATSVKVPPSQKISRYFVSGKTMYSCAKYKNKTGSYEEAYYYYLKYISLFLEEIPKHPDYRTVSAEERQQVKQNIKEMLVEAEKIKQMVLKQYEIDYKKHLEYLEKIKNERKENVQIVEPKKPDPDVWLPAIELSNKFRGGLQKVLIPNSLISKFLELAKSNTLRNVETCALLTGTLHQDSLAITALIVPQQTGSSDDCTAENDLATFNAMESNELLAFGWIHTHPSQEAFLSSVDLHSQYGYQSMLPEAIAIVCAPKHSNEVFRLTDMGLDIIGSCGQKGFHPHPGPPLFETASHVAFTDNPCKIIDLRNSSW